MNRLAIALAAAALLGGAQSAAADGARYKVTFEGTWTAKSHPLDYPKAAHFSALIGATHTAGYAIFQDGGLATPGLKRLAEMGQHSPLDREIGEAMKDGKVGALITGTPIKPPPGNVSVTFDIDDAHPLVSIVAMIAPSPDWFAGVAAMKLREGDGWVARKTYTVYGWDAGTDSGTTFLAPDQETTPRQSVRLLASPQFWSDGRLVPVGTFTFTRLSNRQAAR